MTRIVTAAVAAAGLLLAGAPARAAGLRTKFGEVVVRNLKIGQTYSLNRMLSLPLRVLNTGEEAVELRVDVIKASPETLRAGYEVVPDTGWVRLDRNDFSVEPNHEAVTDVTIVIPNDPALLGRKFEADIWSRTRGKVGAIGVGMQSRLLLQVASEAPTAEELARKPQPQRRLANLDFTLLPTVGEAHDVAPGAEVDLRQAGKASIKLINPNDAPLRVRVRSVPNFEALLSVPAGFEEAPDPKWLRPEAEVVTVPANSIRETGLLLRAPDEPASYGRKLFFPVVVEVLDQEIAARVFYKLLVTTKAKEAK